MTINRLLLESWSRWSVYVAAWLLLASPHSRAAAPDSAGSFLIELTDQATGRGVPCVRLELTGTTGLVYTSDSAGRIVLRETALVGSDARFLLLGDGYVLDPDRPQDNDLTIRVVADGKKTISLHRILAAERLYRITGLDPYWQSRKLNLAPPHAEPLRAKITGQDSAYVTRYREQLFWIWGDTIGLGPPSQWNYEATGALSPLPEQRETAPSDRATLNYFVDSTGFAKPMVAPEDGGTLTWLDGLTTVEDPSGRERLFALYVQMRRVDQQRPLQPDQARHPSGIWWTDDSLAKEVALKRRREIGPEAVEQYLQLHESTEAFETRVTRGVMEYRPATQYFHRVATFPAREIDDLHIGSHAVHVPQERPTHIVFSGLAPNRRVEARAEAIVDIDRYESFTCLRAGVRTESGDPGAAADQLDRDGDGRLRYGWRRHTAPVGPREQAQLVAAGRIEPDERWFVLRDVRTGDELINQHHSLQWNPYRRRYAGLFTCQRQDESSRAETYEVDSLNQTWYGEADTLLGPWAYLEKVVDVGDYAYYNPLYNPYFHEQGGRILYFEGTYTRFMNGSAPMRPRDNYNQVMHRLDLDDPRVVMPAAVYAIDAPDRRYATHLDIPESYNGRRRLCFFAPDRPRPGCVPIYETNSNGEFHLTAVRPDGDGKLPGRIAFYALPRDSTNHERASVYLHRVLNDEGRATYLTAERVDNGAPDRQAFCRVWPATSRFNPYEAAVELRAE